MIEFEGFTARDRVLVVAPHPDDEAIATGGALQVAAAAGAACRVLVVTDGDNNPWPQRWIEKRWRIGAGERARWGAQRRGEALAALEILGVPAADARCLGFTDLGLTDLLMAGDRSLEAQLAAQLAEFAPTHVFLPALADRHPDHSTLHVLMRLALLRHSGSPRLLTFGVHGAASSADAVMLNLTPAQQATKRAAIMRHETQMRLSRRRFVGYARQQEPFGEAAAQALPEPGHPVGARCDADAGRMEIAIDLTRFGANLRGNALFVVATLPGDLRLHWQVALSGAEAGRIFDTAAGRVVATVALERRADSLRIDLPATDWQTAWIKLALPRPGLFVLDRFGWQTVGCGAI